jgi:16S rRNA (cytosine967-C5)-methyltransferase
VLLEVDGGAYAVDRLLAVTEGMDGRDAGLAHELVFGVLRWRARLDGALESWVGGKLDIEVRTALRMGAYQRWFLERVPAHAAVGESVELVKRRKRSAAGLVNAVLRRLPELMPEPSAPEERLSCPAWLLDRWMARFGADVGERIATAFLEKPVTYVRVPAGAEAGPGLTPTGVPGCYRVESGGGGTFRRQDIGSQAVVPLLDLRAGQRFLDLCAAPGNKTSQALEAGVRAVAGELHQSRARMLQNIPHLGVVRLDATQDLPFRSKFDRILVDAPCTGTGTLGRNPEIKWRVGPENVRELAEIQRAILGRALGALAPGGRLVYSTCSLEQEENEEVVAAVLPAHPGVRVEQMGYRLPGREPGDGFFSAVLTSEAVAG